MYRSIKSVIFDVDNTLYDFTYSNGLALNALKEYSKKNFGWTAEEFDEKHLAVQREIYEQLGYNGSCRDRMLRYQKMLEQSSLPLFPHAVKMYEMYWSTLMNTMRPSEGMSDVIKALKEKGLKIGIGSDMVPYTQMLKLELMKVLQYFDFMVTSEEAGEEKPSPKIFNMCIEKAGCLPSECLFIGDDLKKDYYGALSAGMKALWFNASNKKIEDAENIAQITSLNQILKLMFN